MQKVLRVTYTGIQLIRGIAFVGVILAVTVFNPFLWMGLAGYDAHASRRAIAVDSLRESDYQEICPIYRDASTWDKWFQPSTRSLSWCADYIDRL